MNRDEMIGMGLALTHSTTVSDDAIASGLCGIACVTSYAGLASGLILAAPVLYDYRQYNR
jgi:hypothetical protein